MTAVNELSALRAKASQKNLIGKRRIGELIQFHRKVSN